MRDRRQTGKKAARDFVPRKIDLQGRVPDWNLRDTAGLVDSEAANLIKQARGFLGVDVASGFDCEAIEHGQGIFRQENNGQLVVQRGPHNVATHRER